MIINDGLGVNISTGLIINSIRKMANHEDAIYDIMYLNIERVVNFSLTTVLFKDPNTTILSMIMNELNNVSKKHTNDSLGSTNILLGMSVISQSKLQDICILPFIGKMIKDITVDTNTINHKGKIDKLEKRIINNGTIPITVGCFVAGLSNFPASIAVFIINMIISILNDKSYKESRDMLHDSICVKGIKMSELENTLRKLNLKANLIGSIVLAVLVTLPINVAGMIIVYEVFSSLWNYFKTQKRVKEAKGFLI